jgi:hypothetical protein
MSTPTLPSNWTTMTSVQIGSSQRNTSEPGRSRLYVHFDIPVDGVDNPMLMDFLDITLPSLAATSYSTALLAQKKWATQGISRIVGSDTITGTIECPAAVYETLSAFLGAKATARIEVPNHLKFSQWRVGLLSVDGPGIVDGDRMTASLVLSVTNTAPNDKDEMGPVFGDLDSDYSDEDYVDGETLSPEYTS